ncbi:aldehyde dehydrogenase family protein [Subtercola boreus]|uniref:Aldehyde dehydrogenase n=1 Tax=Subtercola boreus TaxID=120213 RepID=A0A3E0WFC0_9MICO|nr:aldehyde dehydrogenase family protein [Subtercola boreus]RFA22737.1 aldehyde dehydrogenase [Subtercola boreus]RFA23092.1 aldehyde dehydrogenase [Subtercola boreus]RFA28845.1 aldehyde dehydrogenase [Subtercola boreus]
MTLSVAAERTTITTHFIDGRWTDVGGPTFPVFNPLDGEIVSESAAGGAIEAKAAVAAAAAAFPAWANLAPGARQMLFLKAADIVERRTEELVELMAVEGGASRAFSAFQIRLSAAMLRQAAGWGYLPAGDILRSDVPGRTATVTRKPLGVVAGFTPWNGAFYLAWRTFLLPMAFGNTTVIKPSELAPRSAGLVHAEILEEAGFPAGTFNVITHAPGAAAEIAEVFFESPAVRCINFTGSDKTARILGAQAGRALKRMVLELGGFNPVIILDDADLEESIRAVTFGAFLHQGQVCMNSRKVYVHSSLHDDFVSGLTARVEGLKIGDPRDPGVIIGPLIDDRAVEQIQVRVQDALDRGATLVTGGRANGRLYPPTILTHVPADAICATGADETFGPLLVIEAFDDAEAAFRASQNTPFGLSASIMTRDRARGLDLAARFDTGIIHINAPTMASEAALPVGGVKDSGWGRSGYYAIEDFTEVRLTTLSSEPGRYPF